MLFLVLEILRLTCVVYLQKDFIDFIITYTIRDLIVVVVVASGYGRQICIFFNFVFSNSYTVV